MFGFSQKKYFKEALEKARERQAFYKVVVDNGTVVKELDIKEYSQKNLYVIKNITYQNVNRFGDSYNGVKSFEFLPNTEIDAYVFEKFVSESITSKSFDEIITNKKGYGYILNTKTNRFEDLQIQWSGDIKNNLLHGSGVGFFKNDYGQNSFYGDFQSGKPVGKIKFISYEYSNDNFENGNKKEENIEILSIKEGIGFYKKNNAFGIIDQTYLFVTDPKYSQIISDFHNMLAVVIYNDKEIIIDTKGKFIEYTSKQKMLDEQFRKKKEEEDRILAFFKPQIDAYNKMGYEFAKMHMSNISPNTGTNPGFTFKADDFKNESRDVTLYWSAAICGLCPREQFEVYGTINVRTGAFVMTDANSAVTSAGYISKGLTKLGEFAVSALSNLSDSNSSYSSYPSSDDNSSSSNSDGLKNVEFKVVRNNACAYDCLESYEFIIYEDGAKHSTETLGKRQNGEWRTNCPGDVMSTDYISSGGDFKSAAIKLYEQYIGSKGNNYTVSY